MGSGGIALGDINAALLHTDFGLTVSQKPSGTENALFYS